MTGNIEHLVTGDGVRLGYRILGAGPAIVIVHGSLTTGEEWLPVAELLAAEHTVIVPDRRGRGLSEDGHDYGLDTEVADLRAVLQQVAGAGATVFGHSYGAVCAAATAAAGEPIGSLVLYEPPLPLNGPRGGGALPALSEAFAAGDHDRALMVSLTDVVQVPEATIAMLRQRPQWYSMVDAAPTFLRELQGINELAGDLQRLKAITERTLVILGTESPQRRHAATDYLANNLPNVEVTKLAGHEHYAHVVEPMIVAEAVRSFLQAGPAEG